MGPMRVFGEALNTLNIEIKFISATSTLKPVRTSHQVEITPHYTIENAPKLDLFFIPGGSGTRGLSLNEELIDLVRTRVRESTWCMSVCTGASILAKTGSIDGYKATTNKSAFQWVASHGPNVDWVKKARWVQDGKFVTSAGVSAGTDAALYVVSELASYEIAEKVSVNMEYTWHKIAGEDPFADMYEYTRS
ncbi:hypothetical protein BGZ99_007675 [Dissophora globulifera]|uniref:DJ-1/PfpI domain-containing protein n=1 Tax=Dissophora globulifera TaxID=979702 RepID=A0A9P6R935_9FUNG|nr:hypothetical protein BGZ99_007675 [Dissophora globulifera]